MNEFLAPPIAAPLSDVDTERLHLRRFHAADLDGLADVFAHREVWQFPYGRAFTRDDTAQFLDNQIREWDTVGFGCWIAVLRETQRIIGYVGLSVPMFLPEILPAVEVGWRFDPSYWGQGFATEGARAALREAFTTMQLDEVTSVPQVDNPRSCQVCDRLGMRMSREVYLPANARRGAVNGALYLLSRDEWLAQQH